MIQVEKIISESLNENEEHLARIKRQMAVLQANPTDRSLLSSLIRSIYLGSVANRIDGTASVMWSGFKGRHFSPKFILLCVCWYLKDNLGY